MYDEKKLAALADAIRNDMFVAHRGAFLLPPTKSVRTDRDATGASDSDVIVFGNDGYKEDLRTQRAVWLIRDRLTSAGHAPSNVVVDTEDDCTWVLAFPAKGDAECRARDVELATSIVWECWAVAWGTSLDDRYATIQRAIAEGVTERVPSLI